MFVVNFQNALGESTIKKYDDYGAACREAMNLIRQDSTREAMTLASVYRTDKPETVLYQLSRPDYDCPVKEYFNYQEIFREAVEHMGFSISRNHDGFRLIDNEDANLGNIEEDTFNSASDIVGRLENYFSDYFFDDVQEEAEIDEVAIDTSDYDCQDWIKCFNAHEEFKYSHFFDYEVFKMLDIDPSELDKIVDLNKIFKIDNYPYEIRPDSPHYEITSYYGDNFNGLQDDTETYDWSVAEEFAHEHLCKGGNVKIWEAVSGKTLRIKADDYCREMENGDFAEFPYKADYFTDKKDTKNKTLIERNE